MSNFHRFRRWAFGTNFVHLRTAADPAVVCRVRKRGNIYTIKYLMHRAVLGPQGRFIGFSHAQYMYSWSIYIAGNELTEFYESEPPQATRTPEPHPLANLSPAAIDWLIEKYNLQRIEDKPKTTQQVYTGKRLIQL